MNKRTLNTAKFSLLLPAFLLSQPLQGLAQTWKTKHEWQTGISAQVYNFWKTNKEEKAIENKNVDYLRINPNTGVATGTQSYKYNDKIYIPNGYSFGVNMTKYFWKFFNIKGELIYTYQKSSVAPGTATFYTLTNNTNDTLYANDPKIIKTSEPAISETGSGISKFHYLKLPLVLNYDILINSRKNIYLTIGQGVQASWLFNYFVSSTKQAGANNGNSQVSLINFSVNNDEMRQDATLFAPDGSVIDHAVVQRSNFKYFNRFNWGSVTTLGLKGEIDKRYSFGKKINAFALLRFEYDFSNSSGKYYTPYADMEQGAQITTPIHNIRAGLDLGLTMSLVKKSD